MAFDGFRRIRCPYCAKEYRLGDFAIYSKQTSTVKKDAPKTALGHFTSGIRPPSIDGKTNVMEQNLRQCPNPLCKGLLPFNIEYVDDNITIAVIGDAHSGKSHFIAAVIQQLKEMRVPPELGILGFRAADSEVEGRYRNFYYDPLFKRKESLAPTDPAIKPLDQPLIYEMRIAGRRVNLLVYDASGEDIAQIDTRVAYKPHILNAQAMIFLADPWSMPGFVNQLAHHLRPNPNAITGRSSADVLTNVIEIFKRASGQARDTHFSLPVAVALSKSDLIPYVITGSQDPRYPALADTQYPSTLTRAESNGIHAVVRQLLWEVRETSLLAMENTVERINFSAITATGADKDSQGMYPDVAPHRCLDPLFWVLRELGVVSG